MSARILLASLAVVVLAAPLAAQLRPSQTQTTVFDSVTDVVPIDGTTQAEEIAFSPDRFDRMTVPVRVGGTGPYRFLVDTGADRTAVSSAIAERLKLVSAGKAKLHSVAGVHSVETAIVPSLQLTRKEVRIAGAPVLSALHMGADGILGVDSLRSQRVQFDFVAGTMSIVPSAERPAAIDKDAIVIRVRERNGRLVLTDARVQGRRVAVIVDTGSEVSLGNDALKTLMLKDKRTLERMGEVRLQGVTGESLIGEYAVLNKLEIGGLALTDFPIVFAEAHTFRQIGLNDKPALLLGMNAMRAFERVSIDFANRKLRLLPRQQSSVEGVMLAARLRM